MSYTLYGSRGSGSAAIEAALEIAGQRYHLVRASSWEADSAQAELARVNPLGQIPTLVLPDGQVMTESAAMLIELGLRHPGCGLLPADPADRAQHLRGLVFIAANCYAAISIGDFPERWTTASTQPARDMVRQAARQRLHAHWDVLQTRCRRRSPSSPAPRPARWTCWPRWSANGRAHASIWRRRGRNSSRCSSASSPTRASHQYLRGTGPEAAQREISAASAPPGPATAPHRLAPSRAPTAGCSAG